MNNYSPQEPGKEDNFDLKANTSPFFQAPGSPYLGIGAMTCADVHRLKIEKDKLVDIMETEEFQRRIDQRWDTEEQERT